MPVKKSTYSLDKVTLRAVFRRRVGSFLLALLMALGTFTAVALHNLTIRQENALEQMVTETRIRCLVTDANGRNGDRLGMMSSFVDMLMGKRHSQGCYLDQYIRDVEALATRPLSAPEDYSLCRILSLNSDSRLSAAEGAKVTFLAGWTEEALRSEEQVCLVPEELADVGPTLTVQDPVWAKPLELTVIGTIENGPENTVYCPFYMDVGDGLTYAFAVESCSFAIGDNTRLDECKAAIYETFVVPSVTGINDGMTFGVLVQDEVYLKTLEEDGDNLAMLRLLQPLLMVLCCCIGFFSSYLTIRGRMKEFAVMRCLGMKQGLVFRLVFEEIFLLTLLGGVAGLTCGVVLEGALRPGALGKALVVMGIFLLGAVVSAMRVTSVNVMKLMKVEE